MELFSEVKPENAEPYIYIYPRIHVNIFKPAKTWSNVNSIRANFFPSSIAKKKKRGNTRSTNNNNAFVARQIG